MDFFENYKKVILERQFDKFGIVLDLRKFEGATPEAISYFHKISLWADMHGAVARALIIDTELKLFALQEHTKSIDFVPRTNFKDEESAIFWLIEKGLSVEGKPANI